MQNDRLSIIISFWNSGLHKMIIPEESLSHKFAKITKEFIDKPWDDDTMECVMFFAENISDYIPDNNDDVNLSWNDDNLSEKENIFEIVLVNGEKQYVLYSVLNPTYTNERLFTAYKFLFNHSIPKSRFSSYLYFRHQNCNTTFMDSRNAIILKNQRREEALEDSFIVTDDEDTDEYDAY